MSGSPCGFSTGSLSNNATTPEVAATSQQRSSAGDRDDEGAEEAGDDNAFAARGFSGWSLHTTPPALSEPSHEGDSNDADAARATPSPQRVAAQPLTLSLTLTPPPPSPPCETEVDDGLRAAFAAADVDAEGMDHARDRLWRRAFGPSDGAFRDPLLAEQEEARGEGCRGSAVFRSRQGRHPALKACGRYLLDAKLDGVGGDGDGDGGGGGGLGSSGVAGPPGPPASPDAVLADCQEALCSFSAGACVDGAEDFPAFCEAVRAMTQAAHRLTPNDLLTRRAGVWTTVGYVVESNGVLWTIKEKLEGVIAAEALGLWRDAVLAEAVGAVGGVHQLLRDVVLLDTQLRTHAAFLVLLRGLRAAVLAALGSAAAVVRRREAGERACSDDCESRRSRRRKRPLDASEAACLADSVERLVRARSSVLGGCDPSLLRGTMEVAAAFAAEVDKAVDAVDRAGAFLRNEHVRAMGEEEAAAVREARVERRCAYRVVCAEALARQARRAGKEAPDGDDADSGCADACVSSSAVQGRDLCVAARRVLEECHPRHHVGWGGAGVAGSLVDFVLVSQEGWCAAAADEESCTDLAEERLSKEGAAALRELFNPPPLSWSCG